MPATLPTPGGDSGTWGTELNTYLRSVQLSVQDFGATGDGVTNDSAAIASAIAALPSTGGVIFFPPGTYVANISLTANKHILLHGPGATIKPSSGSIGIDISGAPDGASLGFQIDGLGIDGSAGGGTTAIRVTNTFRASIRNCRITSCATGIELKSDAGLWCEGTYITNCVILDCTTGLKFNKTASGSGDFAETVIAGLGINNSQTGINVTPGAKIYRSTFHTVTIWLFAANQKGVLFEGQAEGSIWHLGLESTSGVGTVGFDVTATATATHLLALYLDFQGTFATTVQAASGKPLLWQEGAVVYELQACPGMSLYKAADSFQSVEIGAEAAGGGYITLGNGSAAADCLLARQQANVLQTPDQFVAQGAITTKTKAGAPSDADASFPDDGTIILDETNHRLYVRSNGTWKFAALT